MKNQRVKNYFRKEFKDWRYRVEKRMPAIAIKFYSAIASGRHIDYSERKLMGRVILNLSDPYYSIMTRNWEHETEEGELAADVMLRLDVETLFNFVSKLL